MALAVEVNFDGLVGPTHNYAGLSFGNVASESHLGEVSRPKAAALQGLKKMKFVASLGLTQAVLPPLLRPHLMLPRQLGFSGDDESVLRDVIAEMPALLQQIYSASNMWVANAATVSPSADTQDGRVHFTAANLVTHLHRAIEAPETARNLHRIFHDEVHFAHHDPLPGHSKFGDEGAANIMRLTPHHGEAGLEVLVYGHNTKRFPARQTEIASQCIFRRHAVKQAMTLQQSAEAIDLGVFHNDVIAVANENVLLYHEHAFEDGEEAVKRIEEAAGFNLIRMRVGADEVSVEEAVKTYLFNSQLITLPGGEMAIIAPKESEESPAVSACLDRLVQADDNPLRSVYYLNLRESMKNGGGPACLRLRVVLTEAELSAMHPGVLFNTRLYDMLGNWIESHYREQLHPEDLHDPALLHESLHAHEELNRILQFTI